MHCVWLLTMTRFVQDAVTKPDNALPHALLHKTVYTVSSIKTVHPPTLAGTIHPCGTSDAGAGVASARGGHVIACAIGVCNQGAFNANAPVHICTRGTTSEACYVEGTSPSPRV
jgi:hypothetical protein